MKYSLFLWTLVLAYLLTPLSGSGQEQERRRFQPEDMHRIRDVGDMAIAPDGEWVAYTVRETDTDADSRSTDLYMVSWDGQAKRRLTYSESGPRFSPDGKVLAFITARGGDDSVKSNDPKTKRQVWLLTRSGREAERLTEIEGGVSSFEWSPDATRLVLVSKDPEPTEEEDPESETEDSEKNKEDTPKPIVLDR